MDVRLSIILLACYISLNYTWSAEASAKRNAEPISVRDAAKITQVVRKGLRDGQGARLYFSLRSCDVQINDEIRIIRNERSSVTLSPVDIKHDLEKYRYLRFDSDNSLLRLYTLSVDRSLLNISLDNLKFNDIEQYNPILTINAIMGSDQFRRASKNMNPGQSIGIISIIGVIPSSNLPHMAPEIRNLTVDQALDVIANTFHGIVVYSHCPDSKRYLIEFIKP